MPVQRQQFMDSNFMRIELISYEKKWMHHNRYNLQITLDKQNLKTKKKYSQLKRFSEQVEKNLGVKNFSLESASRSNDQFKGIEQLVKRLNGEFLDMREDMDQKGRGLKREIRNYLYNMLFYNEEMEFSQSEEQQPSSSRPTVSSLAITAATKLQNIILPELTSPRSLATNQLKRDKSIKNKSMALAAQLVSTVLKKPQTQPMKQIFKNINIMQSHIYNYQSWLKRGQEWHECRLFTSQTSLILHDRHTNTRVIIILCKMVVYCCEQPYQRIVLSHHLLNEKFQFRLSNITSQNKPQQDPNISDKYLAFYSNLKSLCHKQRMIQTFNFVKIRISFVSVNKSISGGKPIATTGVSNVQNVIGGSGGSLSQVDKKTGREIGVKIIHHTIVSSFTLFTDYPCQIILPVVSNFGVLQLFTNQVRESGVVPNFKENIQNFTIPMQNIYDLLYNQKPKRKTEIQHFSIQGKSCQYQLNMQYFEIGTWQTYYTCDTENDKFQGNIQLDQPNRDQLRIQFNRLKRITWTIQKYVQFMKDWQQFANPLQSYFYYTILVLAIVFADMNYLGYYLIAVVVCIMLYNHPLFQTYKKQLIEYTGLTARYNNVMANIHIKVKGLFFGEGIINQAMKQDLQVCFKIDKQKKQFLQQFELRMRKKRNIYKKYKRLQQILVKFQNKLMQLVNYLEKIKNIFTWYHYKKTRIVYIMLLLVLVVIVFVPIRVILLVVVYRKFKKGKRYYNNTREYNEDVIGEIMMLTVKENKMEDMLQYLNNDTKALNKKESEYLAFQKKLKENVAAILAIEYNARIFQLAKNIKQLKTLLALCKKRYKIPLLVCRKYELNDKFAYKQSSLSKIIMGFISIIPSDRNILGVKASTEPESEQKPQQNDEYKEQVEGFQQL